MSAQSSKVSQLSRQADPPPRLQAGEAMRKHDAFISYSRRNEAFARKLEQALEAYKPPKALGVPQRYLDVFRDTEDFTAGEYHQKLENSLKNSSKLIVICSAEARRSQYVDEEIRLFAQAAGAGHIIPILLSGIPNNEAGPGQEEQMAFPKALCEVMPMPIAISYLGFDAAKDKVDKGVYSSSWYAVLASLYEMSRSEVEQREHKRTVRRRRITYGVLVGSILLLSGLLIWALMSRHEATQQKEQAQRQRKIAEEQLKRNEQLLYVANMRLAQQAFKSGNMAQGQELLEFYVRQQQELRGFEWYYLWSLYHDEKTTLRGHNAAVLNVAFSPDGKTLATAVEDGRVKLWDAATGRERATLRRHAEYVSGLAFSPDGKTLAGGHSDGIVMWDPVTGQEMVRLKAQTDFIRDIAFSPDGKTLAAGGGDYDGTGAVMLWDTAAQELVDRWSYDDSVYSVAFSPDGKTLATGSEHGAVTLCDRAKEGLVKLEVRHGVHVESVAFSPDGRTLATGSKYDKTVKLWDVATGRERATLKMHADYVHSVAFTPSVAFSPDGKTLATCGWDKTAKLWDAATGHERATLKGHTDWVHSVAFSPDGKTLATASSDKTAKLWDTAASQELINYEGRFGPGECLAFSPDGKTLATCHFFVGEVVLWDTATKRELATLLEQDASVLSVAFSPDGKTLAAASSDETVKLWDTLTRQELITLDVGASFEYVPSIAFSPDGKGLAVGGRGTDGAGALMLWDTAARQELATLRTQDGPIESVAFSPDGKTLAAGANSGKGAGAVILWDATTRQELATLKPGGGANTVSGIAFSPDGKTLAAGSYDGIITLWDTLTRQELATLKGHADPISDVAFSPDGKTLATSSADKAVRLWNIATKQEITTLLEKDDSDDRGDFPPKIAFSPDGKTFAVNIDLTVKLCNASTDEEIHVQLNAMD